jgi:hypothetical protein
MAKRLFFVPSLRLQTQPLAVHSLKSSPDFYPSGNVHLFTLIALAIRFRACLNWKKNPSLLFQKTILT